jgi:hypothetical protein
MKILKSKLLLYMFIVIVLAGCSSHMMAVKYEPLSQPAVSSATENVYVRNVVDSRGTPSNWLGAIRGGYGNPLKKLYTDDETALVIKGAFEDALKSRGLLGPAEKAGYHIVINLLKFDTSYMVNKEAHANFTMSLVHKSTGISLFSHTYRTDNKKGGAGAGIFGNVEALAAFAAETLNETIDKALDDPNFLIALKSTPKSSNGHQSTESRLEQLELLRQKGLITDEEYKRKRKTIIEGL